MAAPSEITIKDLTGDWVMNKSLSDDSDPVLSLQGIGWLTRKAISIATVTLHVKQYTEDGATRIDIAQTATGGLKGTTEIRVLNWGERSHEDHLFGKVTGQSRWLSSLDQVEDPYLKEDWLSGEEEKGGPEGEKHIESYVINKDAGWDARQVWGFTIVDGKRHYVRRVVVTKGSTVLRVRLVYDWHGKP